MVKYKIVITLLSEEHMTKQEADKQISVLQAETDMKPELQDFF